MSDFNQAVQVVLAHEGGFANNPADPGGATNYGISLRYLIACGGIKAHPSIDLNNDGKIDYLDIKMMSRDDAIAIYKRDWWDAEHYGDIDNQSCATKVFDLSVNMGHPRAHKLAQQACCACGKSVAIDGVLGPASLAAINACDPGCFLFHIRDQAAQFYRILASHNPAQSVFLNGWLRRAYA